MTRYGAIALGAITLVAVSAVAACSQSAQPADGAPISVGAPSAGTLAQEIDSYAAAEFPAYFSGVAIDSDHRTVIVYRLAGADIDESVHAHFPDAPLRFVDARYTEAQLQTLTRQISADLPYWRQHGVTISVVGPAPDRSAVTIGTPDPAAVQGTLYARYGADKVRVTQAAVPRQDIYTGPVPAPAGR